MFVSCESCVLSGRGLCDELITRPEESYRLWYVVVCDLEKLVNEEALAHWGLSRPKKTKIKIITYRYKHWNINSKTTIQTHSVH